VRENVIREKPTPTTIAAARRFNDSTIQRITIHVSRFTFHFSLPQIRANP
jgi:hypothetical protein